MTLNIHQSVRRMARSSASALVLAATAFGALSAQAQTTLSSSNSPLKFDNGTGGSIAVTSGTTAVIIPDGQQWAISGTQLGLYYDNQILTSSTSSSPFGGAVVSATINGAAGSTIRILGNQTLGWGPWYAFNSLIDTSGNVIIEGSSPQLTGTNTILGNFTILSGTQLSNGESWSSNPVVDIFGSNSVVTIGSGATWDLYTSGSTVTTIGGSLVAPDNTAVLNLHGGTLVVNGQNTTAAPFLGDLSISPGATFIVGDSSHASAIFGDPNHTDGSSLTLTIAQTTGSSAVLQGYGTVYATVNNTGIVQPGGTQGVAGALTVSKFVQGATGQLDVEVSPTGASRLVVLGNASLNGTLNIVIDSGTYGSAIYKILSAGSITGSFSSIETSGNTAGAIAGLDITSTGYSVVTESASGAQVFGHLVSANRNNIDLFVQSLFDTTEENSPTSGNKKATFGNGISAWIQPLGQYDSVSNDGVSYHTTSGGVTGGVEHRSVDDLTTGLAVSYANQSLSTQGGATTSTSNIYDVALYGGIELPNARIDGNIFYNRYDATTKRSLGVDGTANSTPTGDATGASLQISHGIYGNLVVPYMRGTFSSNKQDLVTETGAGPLALKLNAITEDFFVGDLGFRIHPEIAVTDETVLRPEITLAIEHDFSKPGEQVQGQFATLSGSPFTWSWKGDQSTAGLFGIGLAANISNEMEVFGKLDTRFNSDEREGSVQVGLRYRF